jgi:Gluconate 2-dehydrogenase subunit 3
MKRRNALQLVVIGSAAPLAAQQVHNHPPAAVPAPPAGRLRFFTPAQNALVDQLSEMIIPADSHSPGAREAKVSAFIDDILAEAGAETQRAWTAGLEAVEAESKQRFGKPFLEATAAQRLELLTAMADGEENPKIELHRFFVQLKRQTLSGYYTSSVGLLKDLQYKGIVPVVYEPCNHPDHQRPTRQRRK